MTTVRRQVERSQSFLTAVGAFHGWGGMIYALTHLAALWRRPALLAEAEAMVERLPDLIPRDETLDVIGGAAGCIGSLLALHHRAPSPRTLAVATQAGDWLLARARTQENGLAWVTPIPGVKPLTGFSHGAAGKAWALLELAAVTGAERFRTAAHAAMTYERGTFSPEAGNWPDLRDLAALGMAGGDGTQGFGNAWCHGAAGIGLARLRSLRHREDGATRAEVEVALRTTLAEGFGGNHSLCHGDLGNLELLLLAGETLAEPRHGLPR